MARFAASGRAQLLASLAWELTIAMRACYPRPSTAEYERDKPYIGIKEARTRAKQAPGSRCASRTKPDDSPPASEARFSPSWRGFSALRLQQARTFPNDFGESGASRGCRRADFHTVAGFLPGARR